MPVESGRPFPFTKWPLVRGWRPGCCEWAAQSDVDPIHPHIHSYVSYSFIHFIPGAVMSCTRWACLPALMDSASRGRGGGIPVFRGRATFPVSPGANSAKSTRDGTDVALQKDEANCTLIIITIIILNIPILRALCHVIFSLTTPTPTFGVDKVDCIFVPAAKN